MKSEKFTIRVVPGGFATVPADAKACPLLERLHHGPVPVAVEAGASLAEFVARVRRVAAKMGLAMTVCGNLTGGPTVLLREKLAARSSPKPRKGWINNLFDVATRLYDEDISGYDLTKDKDVRELVERISRRVYKYTDCGAWLAPIQSEVWDPQHGHLPARHPDGALVGVAVGSIVEGVDDASTEVHDLPFPFAEKAFWAALQAVEDEASSLWKQTHGCATCCAHWKAEGWTTDEFGNEFEGDDGCTPIWDECPDCGGSGAII